MTPRERLERIFRGEMVDVVPFALKGWRIPQCEAELQLRREGMGIVDSRGVYSSTSPNVETSTESYSEGGMGLSRTTVRTPVGELSSVSRRMRSNSPSKVVACCVTRTQSALLFSSVVRPCATL